MKSSIILICFIGAFCLNAFSQNAVKGEKWYDFAKTGTCTEVLGEHEGALYTRVLTSDKKVQIGLQVKMDMKIVGIDLKTKLVKSERRLEIDESALTDLNKT